MTLSGFFNAPSSIGRRLIVQRNTPAEIRGRVNSAFFVSGNMCFLIGMGIAGLADYIDVRLLVLIGSVLLIGSGFLVIFLPSLGPSRAQWKRTFALLRGVEAAPRPGDGPAGHAGRGGRFIGHIPSLTGMSAKEQSQLASSTLVVEAGPGQVVTYRGEESNAAYYILKGSGEPATSGRMSMSSSTI